MAGSKSQCSVVIAFEHHRRYVQPRNREPSDDFVGSRRDSRSGTRVGPGSARWGRAVIHRLLERLSLIPIKERRAGPDNTAPDQQGASREEQ